MFFLKDFMVKKSNKNKKIQKFTEIQEKTIKNNNKNAEIPCGAAAQQRRSAAA